MITIDRAHNNSTFLRKLHIETPLGTMIAVADDALLYFLHFTNDGGLDNRIQQFIAKYGSKIIDGKTTPLDSIENELSQYFDGTLQKFKTVIGFMGTTFQLATWTALSNIPYGITRSYVDIASSIGKPSASRAIGQTNSRNPLAIIIPCHRVIQANKDLGGYNGGLYRKQWLINHEKNKGTK